MVRSILVLTLVMLGLLSHLAAAQRGVTLAATVQPEAIRLEVTGSPGAGYAVVFAACARGGFFQGHPIDVEYVHPLENLLGGGRLDERGRSVLEISGGRDLRMAGECFLQAVVFQIDDPKQVVGISETLRFRPGPPLTIEPWRPTPWRAWLILLFPAAGLLLGVSARRRGRDPRKRFALAAAVLVGAGLLLAPVRPRSAVRVFAADALAQDRVEEILLGAPTVAALAAVRPYARGADAIEVRRVDRQNCVPPSYLRYYLYPLRLVADAATAARGSGSGALLLTGASDLPPAGSGFRPVEGFAAPGYRLFRVGAEAQR